MEAESLLTGFGFCFERVAHSENGFPSLKRRGGCAFKEASRRLLDGTTTLPFQGAESISLMSRLSPAVMTVLKAVEHSDVSVLLSIQLVAGILLPTRFTNRPDIYIRSNQGFF